MPRFVVCVPTEGAPSVPPCADAGGIAYSPVVMEFPAPGSIEFSNSAELFSYGFTAVVTLWLVGLAVGSILSVIRKG